MPNQDTPQDIGTILDVPEDQRLELDPNPEYNADAGFDINVVPDGEYVDLSSSLSDDEDDELPLDEEDSIQGDGTPEQFITASDPEYARLCEED